MKNNLNEKVAETAGVNVDDYNTAIENLRAAAKAHNDKIADVNTRYEAAVSDKSSEADIEKLREEGKALNKTSLEAFKQIQQEFLKTDDVGVYIGHPNINSNVEVIQGVIAGLQNKELYAEDEESGALDIAYNLNSVHDYAYYIFSTKVGDDMAEMYDANKVSTNKSYWGTDKMVPVYYVGDTLHKLVRQAEDENAKIDYNEALTVYKNALKQALNDVKDYSASEIKGMKKIEKTLK